jgi:hypothetical protein
MGAGRGPGGCAWLLPLLLAAWMATASEAEEAQSLREQLTEREDEKRSSDPFMSGC